LKGNSCSLTFFSRGFLRGEKYSHSSVSSFLLLSIKYIKDNRWRNYQINSSILVDRGIDRQRDRQTEDRQTVRYTDSSIDRGLDRGLDGGLGRGIDRQSYRQPARYIARYTAR
jgi:hypothetical protein